MGWDIKDRIILWVTVIMLFLMVYAISVVVEQIGIKSSECAENYGGQITRGYCVYVKNGTSESFDIWKKQKEREEEKELDERAGEDLQ